MSVHFLNADRTLRIGMNGGIPGKCTLYAREFPTEDVRAYWSMVPYLITVEWSSALGMFFVSRDHRVEDGYDYQPQERFQVMASDAHKLEIWMSVISELCSE